MSALFERRRCSNTTPNFHKFKSLKYFKSNTFKRLRGRVSYNAERRIKTHDKCYVKTSRPSWSVKEFRNNYVLLWMGILIFLLFLIERQRQTRWAGSPCLALSLISAAWSLASHSRRCCSARESLETRIRFVYHAANCSWRSHRRAITRRSAITLVGKHIHQTILK